MKISTLLQFEDFLKTRIPTREALFMGDIGIKRAKHFMQLLGNPQNKIKIIHIAGTSGKGSTAYLTSHILQSQGFNVGLSISPHLFDIRERMQINNQLPDEKLIIKCFNQILPIIQKMESTKFGAPTFFEINVGLAYYIFAKEKVDYAIMETGLGGILDATNTVTAKNKICILTKMGIDHGEILGKTIEKITEQKAGIIQKCNAVISHQPSTKALNVIKNKCKEKNADLILVSKKNYKIISSSPIETIFDFKLMSSEFDSDSESNSVKQIELKKIKLGLIGLHQAENCSLALSCLSILSKRDKFDINENLLRSMLRSIRIPGRMEILKIKDQTVILDGAHNPQKMQTFTSNLCKIYPNQKFIFIVAFKKSKEYKKMLKSILPIAEKIYLSNFSLSNKANLLSSVDSLKIAEFLQKQNFSSFEILKNNFEIKKIIKKEKKPIVITGSLYFIGTIYLF